MFETVARQNLQSHQTQFKRSASRWQSTTKPTVDRGPLVKQRERYEGAWSPQARERDAIHVRAGKGSQQQIRTCFARWRPFRGSWLLSVVWWQQRRWGCSVAACLYCVLLWGLMSSVRGYDNVLLLVTMVSVARLKRLVQGLTLVAATAYTTLLLYQSVSTTVASSTSRLPLRQQVRFMLIKLGVSTCL